MPFKTQDSKAIVFTGHSLEEVADELRTLAEETIEYVYGSVIRKVDEKDTVKGRYDVHIEVKLVRK